jgi:MFS family permease
MSARRGPLARSYPAAVGLVVFSLIPFLALTSALQPLSPVLSRSLHLSTGALQLTSGMSDGAYAIGTVLAVQFAARLPQRRMLVIYTTLFVIASVVTALAPTPGLFIAGHIMQGLLTSLMLIAAVPPLIIGWPVERMPWTVGIMNLGIFGAVAAGPAIGGLQASAGAWRPLFWMVAGCAVLAWLFSLLSYEDVGPQDESAPWDLLSLALATGGCAAVFFGASELYDHAFLSVVVSLPMIAGLVAIIVLVVYQYAIRRPLIPVRSLATTKPVAGILIAMCAGAASVGAGGLVGQVLQSRTSSGHSAVLLLPELGGALLSAVIFGALLRTRLMSALPFLGLASLAGGVAVLVGLLHGALYLVLIGSGMIGVGVGAAVAPALFVAGFSVRSEEIQRVVAIVELLRAVAAFAAGPLIMHIAVTVDGGIARQGYATGLWICFGIAVGGLLLAGYLFVLGRARFEAPDLERWSGGEGPAWSSPRLAAGIRQDPAGARQDRLAHRAHGRGAEHEPA